MPVNQTADFFLGGKPFMLVREEPLRGRAWQRSGRSDAPGRRSASDIKYGELPDEIDHPEVWDDWSGGYGDAYRDPEKPNRVHWSENMDTRFPRQAVHCQLPRLAASIPNTAGSLFNLEGVTAFLDVPWFSTSEWVRYQNIIILGRDRRVQLAVTATQPQVLSGSTLAGVPGSFNYLSAALFGSYAYLGGYLTAGGFYDAMHHLGVTFPETTLENLLGHVVAVAGGRLWRAHGPKPGRTQSSYLQSLPPDTDMALANWSATLSVGNAWNPVESMVGLGDRLFVGTRDGVYAGDQTGTFSNILGDLPGSAHPDNARDLTVFNGELAIQHVGGIYLYTPSSDTPTLRQVWPQQQSEKSPIRGVVRALRPQAGWLYAGLYSGSASYLLAGRETHQRTWNWHILNRFPHFAKIYRIHFDGITTVGTPSVYPIPNRIWAAMDVSVETGGTAPLYYYEIPLGNDNPLAPSPNFSANYVGSARVDLPAVDWQAPSTPKVFRSVEVWADSLLSGYRYADVYHEVDGGTRTLLGRANDSPRSTLFFPTSPFVSGQSIALSLESFSHSPALTPIYRAVVLRGALRPRSVDTITAVARIADNVRDRRGKPMRPGATMLSELRTYSQSATPTALIDLSGAAAQVAVLAPVEEREVYQQGEENPEIAATVRMAVLSFV